MAKEFEDEIPRDKNISPEHMTLRDYARPQISISSSVK